MIFRATRYIAASGLAVLLAGCSEVPKEAGFDEVQKAVSERAGKQVHWNRGTAEDREVADAVRAILHQELTADQAVQVALLNNQNLQATYEDLGVAQAELVEAGLLRNPVLSAEIRFPGRPKLPFEIDVTQEFLDLLYLPLRKRAAGAAFDAAKARVTNEVLKTAAEVKTAFYRAQGAEQLVEMRRTTVNATAASFDAAKRLHDAGNLKDLTFAEERALHERAKIELAKDEAEALDAREELNGLMGVWGGAAAWTMAARLPGLPDAEVEPAGLESLAVSQRADLGAARAEVEAAAQRLGLTRATALFPEASVTIHNEHEPEGTNTIGPGIELPIPLFNQGQPAIAAQQARLRQTQRRYAALAVEVRTEVRRARNRMFAARDRAAYFGRVVVPLQHQIVQQTQLEFNGMLVGVFNLLQAKRDEIEAGREYVEAIKDYWVARAELERAVGGRLEGTVVAAVTQPAAPAQQPTTRAAESQGHQQHQHQGHGGQQ